jgi:hypothetical protein
MHVACLSYPCQQFSFLLLLLPGYFLQVDYKALVSAVEKMSAEQFEQLDLDQLVSQYSR